MYFLRAGCAWWLLPHDFPPWQAVYYYLRRWEREGVWAHVHHTLLMADRERAGRDASPTAAIIDSQSVRTADQKGGAKGVLKRSCARFSFVEHIFADGGYAGKLVTWAKDKTNITIEVVRRLPFMKGFVVLRRRWVVERTFAWIMKCRRLVRNYEQLPRVVETLITIAAIATLVRQW